MDTQGAPDVRVPMAEGKDLLRLIHSDGRDEEVSEWVMNVAREEKVHYLTAGHYATERLGIRALGEHLREKLGLEAEFIDVWNPV